MQFSSVSEREKNALHALHSVIWMSKQILVCVVQSSLEELRLNLTRPLSVKRGGATKLRKLVRKHAQVLIRFHCENGVVLES